MIKNEFEHLEGAMAKAARKRDTRFVVHALDHGVGVLALGAKVVEQEILVVAQHFGDLLHRSDAGAHCPVGPLLEISGGPSRAAIKPEATEAFLEFPGPRGLAERGKHGVEFVARLAAHFGASLEQEETSALGLLAGGFIGEPCLLAPSHGIDRFVEVFGDMKGIEHVEGMTAAFSHNLQEGLPHVGTNHPQVVEEAGLEFFEFIKTFAQGGLGAGAPDPEQAARAPVDLIDKGEEIQRGLAASVVEFVDAHGGDLGEVTVLQPVSDHPFHRSAHRVPTGREDFGDLLPGQPSGPAGQEVHVGDGVGAFAVAPRHHFDRGLAGQRADHPAGCIVKEHGNVPERHEIPLPRGQLVVNAPGAVAAGAAALAAWIGFQVHINAGLVGIQAVADVFDDKTGKVLHAADKCFNSELNGGCGVVCCVTTPFNARDRHSQAPAKHHVEFGKAEGFCRAKPIAASRRSPQPLSSGPAYKSPPDTAGRQRSRFYAAGPLDSGEERASSHLRGPFAAQNPHKFP